MDKNTIRLISFIWVALCAIAFFVCIIMGYVVLQDWNGKMHAQEERQLNERIFNTWCQGVKVTSSLSADIIMYDKAPEISPTPRLLYGFKNETTVKPQSASYMSYYLLAGSKLTILVKAVGGEARLQIFHNSLSNSPVMVEDVPTCSFLCQYERYNYTATANGLYYVYFFNKAEENPYLFNLQCELSTDVIIHRTVYLPPRNGSGVLQACLQAKKCSLDLPLRDTFILYKSGNWSTDHIDHQADVKTSCEQRIWFFFVSVVVTCWGLAGLLTMLVVCMSRRRAVMASSSGSRGIWSHFVSPQGHRINFVLFEDQVK